MWKLVLSHGTVSLIVAGIVSFGVWRIADVHHQRAIGVWQERVRIQDSVLRAESHQIDSLKAAFHTDTVRLTRSLIRYDSIKDTLQVVLHDTTVKRDTLIQVVERYRDRADSTIQDCRISLAGCVALSAHQDTLIKSLQTKVTLQQSQQGHFGAALSAAKWLGVGFAAGYVAAKH